MVNQPNGPNAPSGPQRQPSLYELTSLAQAQTSSSQPMPSSEIRPSPSVNRIAWLLWIPVALICLFSWKWAFQHMQRPGLSQSRSDLHEVLRRAEASVMEHHKHWGQWPEVLGDPALAGLVEYHKTADGFDMQATVGGVTVQRRSDGSLRELSPVELH